MNPTQWLDSYRRAEPDLVDSPPRSDWPSEAHPITAFATLAPHGLRPSVEVFIGLLPTTWSWEAPAYLHWGGWNDCPMPEVHVALQPDWQARYGSEIVVMHHDVIECRVAQPPTSREAALALANEQFAYCYDIVYQGTETLDALAAGLLNGTVWYFWWD